MKINLILEGLLEEPVARKLVEHCGHTVGTIHGRQGCSYIKSNAHKYHSMALAGNAVFVLTDFMDSGCDCIVDARNKYLLQHLPQPDSKFLLRFAVAELESWILADRNGLSAFLCVHIDNITKTPDLESDPKKTMVAIARRSTKNKIKQSIVPSKKHGGPVAPGYRGAMQTFVLEHWDIESAITLSPSLERCVNRLNELA